MNRLRLILTESVRSLGANLSTTVAATMTVLIGMFLLGLMIAFGTWTISWSNHVKKELLVKVYFTDTATPQQVNAVAAKLQADRRVSSVQYVSKAQALREMKQRFPDLFKTALPSNPLPASERVTPKRAEDIDAISASLQPLPPGVFRVTNAPQRSHRILQVAHLIDVVFLIAVVILVIASTLLIANTIRLSIFSRRREIEVMKLVGATNWFVRGPFMLEGLLEGLIGGALAFATIYVFRNGFTGVGTLTVVGPSNTLHVTSTEAIKTGVVLMVAGAAMGVTGSAIAVRRFLTV